MVFVQRWRQPKVKISAQSDVVYCSYCPIKPQNGHNWVLDQKNVLFLLGKIENNKNTETETWRLEGIEEWSYYRLCENFW